MTLKKSTHVWHPQEQPHEVKSVTTYAVCGCGIHTDVLAGTLICPHCRKLDIRESPGSKPGYFTVRVLYRCSR